MTALRYPLELAGQQGQTDYIQIDTFEYRTNRQWAGNGGGAGGPRVGAPIILYMPNSTPPMNNPNTWQGKSFSGPLGELIGEAAAGVTNMAYKAGGAIKDKGVSFDAAKDAFMGSKSDINAMIKSLKENAGPAVGQGITKMVGQFAGVSENQMLALAKNEIFNPNMELLYEGPQLRSFQLNFTFLPKSADEAATVVDIIKHFKENASPSGARDGNMFKVPNVFQVTYKMNGQDHPFMNRFKRAALGDVNVTYNAGLPFHSSFVDGMPVKTDLTLMFMEVDIITREDHEEAPVGF